jgi:hypothetical protein
MRALRGENDMSTFAIRLALAGIAGILSLTVSAEANAPAGRYTTTGVIGTVYDTKTKLTWLQTVPAASYTWAEAKTYCESPIVSYNFGGLAWRLPTVKELMTIVDYSQAVAPLIDPTFPETPADVFWSSTPLAAGTSIAWYVDFNNGSVNYTNAGSGHYIRCVH